MANLGEKKVTVINVERKGDVISVPESISMADALSALQRKVEEEEKTIAITEEVNAFVWDGALAFTRAMEDVFGFSMATETYGMWGDKQPPQMISVETGFGTTALVPWGAFQIPGVPGVLETSYIKKDGRLIFAIKAKVQKKNEHLIRKVAERTREIVREQSIYKGKAFSIRFYDQDGEMLVLPEPKFIDLSKVDENGLIFSRDISRAIEQEMFVPVERTDECRRFGIPLKRGVLLAGPYGTGKTLAGFVLARKAVRNAWTFIYCPRIAELTDCLRFANQYAPAVVFAEDIDQTTRGERTAGMTDISNTLDGVDTKGNELIVVLTTNHEEKINKVMLRPGRIDSYIQVLPPDAEAVAGLLRLYGRGLIPSDENLTAVGVELAGEIPAVIAETVEKAKLAAISMQEKGAPLVLTGEALLRAAVSMKPQRELLREKTSVAKTEAEIYGESLGRELGKHSSSIVGALLRSNTAAEA